MERRCSRTDKRRRVRARRAVGAWAVGTFGLLSLITSCEPAGSAAPVPDRAVRAAVLTANGSGTYLLQGAPPDVTASAAPPGVSSNLREAFWSDGQSSAVDGEACVSWGPNDQVAAQPGVALRIATSTPGHVRALTVSKNVWFTAGWLFNVHVFDTSQPDFRQLATFDLGDVWAGSRGQRRWSRSTSAPASSGSAST